ncbi:26868_t:CDS:1, partial [Gigaspora margarita]
KLDTRTFTPPEDQKFLAQKKQMAVNEAICNLEKGPILPILSSQ